MKIYNEIIAVNAQLDKLLRKKYGSHGQHPLTYHCEWHSRLVAEAARELGLEAGMEEREVALLGLAGMGHDIEHGLGSGQDEHMSVQITHNLMDRVGGFRKKDRDFVGSAILSTIIHYDANGNFTQSADSDDFGMQLLADADLASLGRPRPQFLNASERLFHELYPEGGSEQALLFDRNQVRFMSGHNFYTVEADILFPHQNSNLAFIQKRLDDRLVDS